MKLIRKAKRIPLSALKPGELFAFTLEKKKISVHMVLDKKAHIAPGPEDRIPFISVAIINTEEETSPELSGVSGGMMGQMSQGDIDPHEIWLRAGCPIYYPGQPLYFADSIGGPLKCDPQEELFWIEENKRRWLKVQRRLDKARQEIKEERGY